MSASTDNCKNIITTLNSATLLKKPPGDGSFDKGITVERRRRKASGPYGARRGIAGLPVRALLSEPSSYRSAHLHSPDRGVPLVRNLRTKRSSAYQCR